MNFGWLFQRKLTLKYNFFYYFLFKFYNIRKLFKIKGSYQNLDGGLTSNALKGKYIAIIFKIIFSLKVFKIKKKCLEETIKITDLAKKELVVDYGIC